MDLQLFMAKNKKTKEPLMYAATSSLCDKDGNAVEWEITGISTQQDKRLRLNNTKIKKVKGVEVSSLDSDMYLAQLAVASISFPDLNDADLQDSYGVQDAVELLQAMVDSPGEYAALINTISEYNGFSASLDDKIEEAKN